MSLEEIYTLFLKHPGISTDSRHIVPDSLFFALKGENFNGNHFAEDALAKGAAYAIVDEAPPAPSDRVIVVADALKCLQDLGTHHRRQCRATVIALTGSNGKTTTKELIAAVLGRKYRTLATAGNLNNHIGVPLTLLRLQADTEMAVVEMGANHQKEIAFLSGLAEPDYGYITNFGKAHLEGFGGVQGVIKGKSELYDYLISAGKSVFFNADDPIQCEKLQGYANKSGFSTHDPGHYRVENLGAAPFVTLKVEDTRIQSRLSGGYNFSNCAVAALIGHHFNVPLPLVRDAIETYLPQNNRSQLLTRGGLEIILDAYNANPSSMGAALEHLASLPVANKVAILGDMFELGDDAGREHQAIADLALELGLENAYLVGREFSATKSPFRTFESFEALADYLKANSIQGPATLLIKASRGMALERLLDYL
ncbi:UDP-N-acetylmuramoyl-tripeptide--D-alanyl-D-alanine ligase [Robiginitalea marina]|uniref:UDP-N-acetylmuramoyl-tripeptide--D-alanyl-D-alanine ligase n=1 Tax=Robiginitalea marina TaxID=2954105 RepID=A0ABT1AYX5_9FLAO|nr:UDP-N-acetylmuramoyl-tripeptide--D-alanyl-D-alanine ligase [Robiginitalea marina]MCO5725177.1 UDP-N-acetylmuramoyl-tripeptide--D-alanyl-D-alanine ligase [Robiginitalea marina]